jgi:hypothetical protein
MSLFTWLKEIFFGKTEEPKVEVVEPAPKPKAAPKKVVAKAEEVAVKVTKASLSKLTKAQLEDKGREFGVELDRRKKKDDLVAEVLKASKK